MYNNSFYQYDSGLCRGTVGAFYLKLIIYYCKFLFLFLLNIKTFKEFIDNKVILKKLFIKLVFAI